MATIELAHLSDHLEEHDLEGIIDAVQTASGEAFASADEEDSEILESSIDDDVFTDFRDRLEANDLDADVYVPFEFDDLVQVGDLRIGSTQTLRLVLDSLREDFFVEDAQEGDTEEDDAEDDFERDDIEDNDEASSYYADEDAGIEMKDEQLRHVWRAVFRASRQSLDRNMPLFFHH
ncbi:MAG: hypothetical protein GY811_30995 [Myxococcales bacterium]|nr:hypothetical protein [Myxococcales bacterium]